jgi:hypothetical protein
LIEFFKAKDGAVSGVKMIAYDDPVAYSVVNMDLKKGVEINSSIRCWAIVVQTN